MINYLKGRLVEYSSGLAVIEIGGIGIAVQVPTSTDELLKKVGTEVTLYTRLLIKDENILLYGFNAAEERKLFNLVMSVSGFGPRLTLALLGAFSVSQLYVAVLEENIQTLCRAPGIGKKAAQRLVLELKEKLPKTLSAEELALSPTVQGEASVRSEVIEALCALGYSDFEASAAVNKTAAKSEQLSREELLKQALRSMTES